VKDIRERMTDMDTARLPGIADAKKLQKLRQDRDGTRAQDTSKEIPRVTPKDAPKADRGKTGGTPERPGAGSHAAAGIAHSVGDVLGGIASLFEHGFSGDGEARADKESKPEPPPRDHLGEQRAEAVRTDEADKTARLQALSREFGRDIQNEQEADWERGRERQRRGE
jgi:hypothetical protein